MTLRKKKEKSKQKDSSVFSIKQSNSKDTAFLHGRKLANPMPRLGTDSYSVVWVSVCRDKREMDGPNEHYYTIIRAKKGKQ
jgi:hypothetical protein